MKLLISILILCQIVTNQSFADEVIYLPKSSPAPFSGYLMDDEKVTKIRLINIDYQEALRTKDYLEKDNVIYVKRLENLSTENDKLATQLVATRDTSIWSKLGFFVLGAVLTTGVVFGVSRAAR